MDTFLYNGVELPKLPEWDKTTFPYACLAPTLGQGADNSTTLVVVTRKFKSENKYLYWNSNCYYMTYRYNGTGEWYESLRKTQIISAHKSSLKPFWANVDVFDTSGQLYLPASSPVFPYDHTAMAQGWLVGKRLAAQRGKA